MKSGLPAIYRSKPIDKKNAGFQGQIAQVRTPQAKANVLNLVYFEMRVKVYLEYNLFSNTAQNIMLQKVHFHYKFKKTNSIPLDK